MNLHEIPLGKDAPKRIHAIVEIPRGTRSKYEYVAEWDAFLLDRVLAGPLRFPTAYGFIPQTAGMDGDTMDVLLLQDEPAFTGSVVCARPVAVFKMMRQDGSDADEKIVAVVDGDPVFGEARSVEDLPQYVLDEIDYFFRTYKDLEGKHYETEWKGKKDARAAILKRHEEWKSRRG